MFSILAIILNAGEVSLANSARQLSTNNIQISCEFNKRQFICSGPVDI